MVRPLARSDCARQRARRHRLRDGADPERRDAGEAKTITEVHELAQHSACQFPQSLRAKRSNSVTPHALVAEIASLACDTLNAKGAASDNATPLLGPDRPARSGRRNQLFFRR
jgi:hypothetical protein